MARPFGTLSTQIIRALQMAGATLNNYTAGPLGSRRNLARWLHQLSTLKVPYDTRFRRTVYRLHRKGFIRFQHHQIELVPEVIAAAKLSTDLDQLSLKRPTVWDELWRMVIWDIPETKRELREIFRRKLASLGFVRIQGSVWVTPYPCRQEVAFLRSTYGLSEGVLYVEASIIEGEQHLRQHFHLDNLMSATDEITPPFPSLTNRDRRWVERLTDEAVKRAGRQ